MGQISNTFDSNDLAKMTTAFNLASTKLGALANRVVDHDLSMKDIVGKAIVKEAGLGERDPAVLAARAIDEAKRQLAAKIRKRAFQ